MCDSIPATIRKSSHHSAFSASQFIPPINPAQFEVIIRYDLNDYQYH